MNKFWNGPKKKLDYRKTGNLSSPAYGTVPPLYVDLTRTIILILLYLPHGTVPYVTLPVQGQILTLARYDSLASLELILDENVQLQRFFTVYRVR